jgi:hypothetical protein
MCMIFILLSTGKSRALQVLYGTEIDNDTLFTIDLTSLDFHVTN